MLAIHGKAWFSFPDYRYRNVFQEYDGRQDRNSGPSGSWETKIKSVTGNYKSVEGSQKMKLCRNLAGLLSETLRLVKLGAFLIAPCYQVAN